MTQQLSAVACQQWHLPAGSQAYCGCYSCCVRGQHRGRLNQMSPSCQSLCLQHAAERSQSCTLALKLGLCVSNHSLLSGNMISNKPSSHTRHHVA